MRIAIVSDIHGNRTAFDALLTDLRHKSPDLVLHGGDLVESGSASSEIVDHIRDLGWSGVLGNTDEIHTRPESLDEFASQSSAPQSLWAAIREMAAVTRTELGADRIAWLAGLPRVLVHESFALLHATLPDAWRSPGPDATDDQLRNAYEGLEKPLVVYGHVHFPFVRRVLNSKLTVINTGSVGLSYDGDPRLSYLLLDGIRPILRRVEYDIEKEVAALKTRRLPHADWIVKMLRSAKPQLP
jgi:predicted phosphodiesterase